jgi:hypothetical protein
MVSASTGSVIYTASRDGGAPAQHRARGAAEQTIACSRRDSASRLPSCAASRRLVESHHLDPAFARLTVTGSRADRQSSRLSARNRHRSRCVGDQKMPPLQNTIVWSSSHHATPSSESSHVTSL